METTDMQAIREEANKIRECVDFSWHNIGNSSKLDEARKRLDNINAILDKIDKSGEGEVVPDAWMHEDSHACMPHFSKLTGGAQKFSIPLYRHPQRPTPSSPDKSAPAKAPAGVVEAGQEMRDQFWELWDTLAKNGAGWFPTVEHVQRITTSIVNWDAALKSNTDEHGN